MPTTIASYFGEIAECQGHFVEHVDLNPHLAQGFRQHIVVARDVADMQACRDREVEHVHGRHRPAGSSCASGA